MTIKFFPYHKHLYSNLGLVVLKNQDLKKTKEFYQSDAFLEEQIRNKLQMAKPEEKIIILPEAIVNTQSEQLEESEQLEQLANWEKWLRLFK